MQAARVSGVSNARRRASPAAITVASSVACSDRSAAARRPPVGAVGRQRAQKGMRAAWSSAARDPHLRGSRAAAWITVWDSACASRRVCMLESLRALHGASNSNEMEEDLGSAAPLLLTRITSWWKLRYGVWISDVVSTASASYSKAATAELAASRAELKSPPKDRIVSPRSASEITLDAATEHSAIGLIPKEAPAPSSSTTSSSELLAQVEAMTIFLRGSRFLLQFVEGGGVATLTDCLETTAKSTVARARTSAGAATLLSSLLVQERRAITLLLLHIVNAGRVYRELVGEEEGLLHVLRTLQHERDASVAAPLTELLAVLGQGHPRQSRAIQTGLLRVLEKAMQQLERTSTTQNNSVISWRASEVVVLHTARAIRALQLQQEQHHYARFHSSNGSGALETDIDYVPLVGLDNPMDSYRLAGAEVGGLSGNHVTGNPLLKPMSRSEYLDTLFQLVLDDQHAAHQAEGNELLSMAAKNLQLTQDILTRCLDTIDDDDYTIQGDEEKADVVLNRQRRQRRQLSCGRTAVLLLTSRPTTNRRKKLLLDIMSQRSGHLSLLKNLRLAAYSDAATLMACCQALQLIVRGAADMQRQNLGVGDILPVGVGNGADVSSASSGAMWLRVTQSVQAALGESMFQMLLFQNLSEEDCMAILRAARDAVVPLSFAQAS